MRRQIEGSNAIITFLNDVKVGKYVSIDKDIIDIPRNNLSRDEYIFDDECTPVFYSMSN